MQIYNNPSGEAYYRLIDYAMEKCETFSLKDTRTPGGEEYDIPPMMPLRIAEELKPYLVGEKWSGVGYSRAGGGYFPYDQPVYIWKCCPEAAVILKKYTDNLLGWIGKGMPEDLCFQNAEGGDWLRTVTHEEDKELRVTAEEAELLRETLRGVMLGDYRDPLAPDETFELARYHASDRLNLSGTGTAGLLHRLHEIPSLRTLELFDAAITELPDSLFDLPLLEELNVYTRDLHGIPAAVGRAKTLQKLSVSNGSHLDPNAGPDWKPPAKEELTMKILPPEIGQLENLLVLDINYSGLTGLPDELGNLHRLQYLTISNHLIDGKPAVLRKLRHARNVTFRRDGFF
ncbi:hypothetical protein QWJ34_15700 [Saccharibacillus sp. CPCC 101409]|uniref:leucine-rich repeat domain-containing protein n=1 Tax=Saccharibacillus sp. CPCC 101409 TaxID=3058041 RepID=UPI002672E5B7|nr:hypothetical protein [Saccharibacillus sp. CPCC 101409]MDO3411210.1 hypothetical protein [Saccharibacillus sp. CPCC 101409]